MRVLADLLIECDWTVKETQAAVNRIKSIIHFPILVMKNSQDLILALLHTSRQVRNPAQNPFVEL